MTYATVMVSLALGRSNDARLEIAGQLAKRFDARVIWNYRRRVQPAALFHDGRAGPKGP